MKVSRFAAVALFALALFTNGVGLAQSPENQGDWWKSTRIYQVYPRSFKDTNGDGIGDLEGVISKLDYLKDLGIETIWICPFFKCPQKDFGYDISDYLSIAPEYGDHGVVDRLIAETHRRGMKILFDMVMNHTSNEHAWFVESSSSQTNDKSDWYIWRDGKGDKPPNNWFSALGKPGWHYEPRRKQWYFASFLPFQPDLNYRNPKVKEAMLNQVRFWLARGVDGFRLDIFNVIYKDAQFRNNPKTWHFLPNDERVNFQIRKYTQNLPESYEFAKELRKVVDEFQSPSRMLIGEVMGTHEKIKPFLGEHQDGLNLIFLFDVLKFKFKASFFREKLELYEEMYPAPLVPTYVFSNHDQMRSLSRLGGDVEKAKLLALFQFTARGVPVIYQGEEIGMTNANLKGEKPLDPVASIYSHVPEFIVKLMKLIINRDVVRTPFQWDRSENAGFCDQDCKPWLPVSSNFKENNLEVESEKSNSLFSEFKNVIALRNQYPAFQTGAIRVLSEKDTGNKHLLAYDRMLDGETYRVVLNFGKRDFEYQLKQQSEIVYSSDKGYILGQKKIKSLTGVVYKVR